MDKLVQEKFASYPKDAQRALKLLRKLILKSAKDSDAGTVSEVLKWNEPSYITKNGSTVRIDWKPKFPSKIFVFFHCQTSLIEVFKELYGSTFTFDGKRAIVFNIGEEFPAKEFEHCVSLALRYHQLKHLPLLGA